MADSIEDLQAVEHVLQQKFSGQFVSVNELTRLEDVNDCSVVCTYTLKEQDKYFKVTVNNVELIWSLVNEFGFEQCESVVNTTKKIFNVTSEGPVVPREVTFTDSANQIIVLKENLLKENFKEAVITDPSGLNFGKAVEVARKLAVWHAASSFKVDEGLGKLKMKSWMAKIAADVEEQSRRLELPLVVSVGDLRPENLQLRYRGCGMYDVLFKSIAGHSASPVFDLICLLTECIGQNEPVLEDLLQIYHSRYSEVCQRFDKPPLRATKEELNRIMQNFLILIQT